MLVCACESVFRASYTKRSTRSCFFVLAVIDCRVWKRDGIRNNLERRRKSGENGGEEVNRARRCEMIPNRSELQFLIRGMTYCHPPPFIPPSVFSPFCTTPPQKKRRPLLHHLMETNHAQNYYTIYDQMISNAKRQRSLVHTDYPPASVQSQNIYGF